MTKIIRLLLVLVGALLFAVGLLVGQQIRRSKFEKYLQQANVTTIKLGVLEAKMNVIRGHLASHGHRRSNDILRPAMSLLLGHDLNIR